MSEWAEPVFGFAIAKPHRVFAWYPINTDDQGWVWLRFIYRRRIQKHLYLDGPVSSWWQYWSEP